MISAAGPNNAAAILFGAIQHPVKVDKQTGEKDLGPAVVRTAYSTSWDVFQQKSAEFYAEDARRYEGDTAAFNAEAAGERGYAFTGQDALDLRARLESDVNLQAAQGRLTKIQTASEEAKVRIAEQMEALHQRLRDIDKNVGQRQDAVDTRSRELVQAFLDANADRVTEVPYRWGYTYTPPADKAKAEAAEAKKQQKRDNPGIFRRILPNWVWGGKG